MDSYKFLEIIRDQISGDLIGATLIYESNGAILRHFTTSETETFKIIDEFTIQKSTPLNTLKGYGDIYETTDKEISSGRYRSFNKFGFSFPNLAFFEQNKRNRRSEKYEKEYYNSIKSHNYSNNFKTFIYKNKRRLVITSICITLLASGSFGLVKHHEYNKKYAKYVQTFNFKYRDFKNNYGMFDSVMSNLINGNYNEINPNDYTEFKEILHEIYDTNFASLRGEMVDDRPKFNGSYYNFHLYYDEGATEYEVLQQYEDKYGDLIERHANTLKNPSYNIDDKLENFSKELYDFIVLGEPFENSNIRFKNLDPMCKLIILEMFNNVVESSEYNFSTTVGIGGNSRIHVMTSTEQILNQISAKKNDIVKFFDSKIRINDRHL